MRYSDAETAVRTPLQAHYEQCTYAAGLAHRLQCGVEAVRAFVAPRIVSTLLVMTVLVGVILSLQFGAP
jgi:hypothetical protein